MDGTLTYKTFISVWNILKIVVIFGVYQKFLFFFFPGICDPCETVALVYVSLMKL